MLQFAGREVAADDAVMAGYNDDLRADRASS